MLDNNDSYPRQYIKNKRYTTVWYYHYILELATYAQIYYTRIKNLKYLFMYMYKFKYNSYLKTENKIYISRLIYIYIQIKFKKCQVFQKPALRKLAKLSFKNCNNANS